MKTLTFGAGSMWQVGVGGLQSGLLPPVKVIEGSYRRGARRRGSFEINASAFLFPTKFSTP